MAANLERITFRSEDISRKRTTGLSNESFVPLADVPDLAWKVGPHKRGGQRSPEHPNHFADMDRKDSQGRTLLQICRADPAKNVRPKAWLEFYEDPAVNDETKGLLPFRVWQIYDKMVGFVRDADVARFVCAAGILAHYVGDSCQPLHCSYLFDGDPDTVVDGGKKGQHVHTAYEKDMVDYHTAEILAGIEAALRKGRETPSLVRGGPKAAQAAVRLMQRTFDRVPPRRLVNAYAALAGRKPKEAAEELWKRFGTATVEVLADGVRTLALLWDSAWKEGQGDTRAKKLAAIPEKDLAAIYRNPGFLRAYYLKDVAEVL